MDFAGVADKVAFFQRDFRIIEQAALFREFFYLVEVFVIVLVFGGEHFDKEAAVLQDARFFFEVIEGIFEAVVCRKVPVAALVFKARIDVVCQTFHKRKYRSSRMSNCDIFDDLFFIQK